METLEKIEKEIRNLSENELLKFRQWFAEFDSHLWDAKIESDAAAGKLNKLAEEALQEYHAGKAIEI